jgi:Flp pilus assembly pilin Flp
MKTQTPPEDTMWGRTYRERLQAVLVNLGERGAAATEYTVMIMGMVIVVIASLVFLGGSVGGSFSDVVINSPIVEAGCKLGGWTEMTHPDGTPFKNQGDCQSYQQTGK